MGNKAYKRIPVSALVKKIIDICMGQLKVGPTQIKEAAKRIDGMSRSAISHRHYEKPKNPTDSN